MLECFCMRTTIEISEDQRVALAALAARRGLRGFSRIVQEAIDRYLAQERASDVEAILRLRGVLSDSDADELERRIGEAWASWPTAS
jgi:hypothetical protein